ncbi:hypothetical protein U8335_19865 [Roseiconus lacunae]|uniref:hypothetical protein n=1 Tax=Roseiconus lacunae TaxID=2605694 RepID=UPI00308FA89D|nr:hypothetical protein U8335_19865 [Stieleria sp. HD01]
MCIASDQRNHVAVVALELRNPNPMDHPGGNWDLGADGNVVIDELAVCFEFESAAAEVEFELELLDQDQRLTAKESIELFQASSGGEHWRSSNHLDRHHNVPWEFCGYRGAVDGQPIEGKRAMPVLHARAGTQSLSIGVPNFWQNFPAAISASGKTVKLSLLPAQSPGGHELQGGEQKTFEFYVAVDDDSAKESMRDLVRDGSRRIKDEAAARKLKPLAYLAPSAADPKNDHHDPRYEALVNLAVEGEDSFFAKREKIDEYGWRHFGDIWGDHEAVFHQGDSPLISHYNNQYDCTLGFGIQYLRSGDKRWLDLMMPMADHAWDIDTYHTDQDKLLYNGGLFWHTYHYADAHTSTHRSYPKLVRQTRPLGDGQDLSALGETGKKLERNYQIGGGPAASHNYNTGWMLAYHLTGKERYKEAAINAADYVMRIDDGSQTPFRWLSRSDTGYSTCSSEGYYGPGRASGNSTHALLTGHELTGDRKYLDRAAKLMRRTVHPKQDLDALDLLNAELRWFYTMYLQALTRYVDYKLSLGETDDDFRYGVACLRHYARWMAEHERPTLSEPDKLQYPTETWAAQDFRKWQVLEHAARYECDPRHREKMWEKAEFFYHYCIDYLTESPTKSLCRPVVLVLNFGWQRPWYLEHRDQPAFDQPIDDDFGQPMTFVPQREIAIRRFKRLVVAGGLVGFLLVALLVVMLVASG